MPSPQSWPILCRTLFNSLQTNFRLFLSSVTAIPHFMLPSVEKQSNCSPFSLQAPLVLREPKRTSTTPTRDLKPRKSKNLPSKSKRRIELADVPDEVINKVLECYILITKGNSFHLRTLNKRLAILALPFCLQTVSVSSPGVLSNLILSPESPLYNSHLGKHVKCLELCYVPRTFELLEVDKKLTQSLPNLATIRFKFSMGVAINPGLAIQPYISQDVLLTSFRLFSGTFLRRFLSQLRPRRFEWVSPEAEHLYLVGVYPMLRSLFCSWDTLSYIYLEGICLIEQPNLACWHISLLANWVHIKAPFSKAGPSFLDGLQNLRNWNSCSLLLLEESSPENTLHDATVYHGDVPVLTYGNTMVSLKYWSTPNRQELKSRVVGRLSRCTSTHKSLDGDKQASPKPAPFLSVRVVLPLFLILAGLCTMYFAPVDILKGTYTFGYGEFLWIICHDGSYIAEVICESENSLWFPDRSLMLHPT